MTMQQQKDRLLDDDHVQIELKVHIFRLMSKNSNFIARDLNWYSSIKAKIIEEFSVVK